MLSRLSKKFKKNLSATLANSEWERKAIWLEADYPESISRTRESIKFRKLDLTVDWGQFEFLLDGYQHLSELKEFGGFSFRIEREVVLATNGEINVEVHTAEELFILIEIFLRREYDFRRSDGSVLIDIGMNVGFASLYFASRPDVEHVYGFEPFSRTFEQCQRNMNLNLGIASKVTRHCFGLASEGAERSLSYDFKRKGQMSTVIERVKEPSSGSIVTETVVLKPVIDELEEIAQRHQGTPLVLKIDCEGAEHELFRSFVEFGIPRQVRLIMMEWHEGDIDRLSRILIEQGFEFVRTSVGHKSVGMLYAFRTRE